MRFREAFLKSINTELYQIEDREKEREGMALFMSPQRQLHPQRMLIGVHSEQSAQLLSLQRVGLLPGPVSQVTGNCFISGAEVLL